jgi:hypothetical protein
MRMCLSKNLKSEDNIRMKKVRSEEVQSNIPPEFLFRIATKINVANRATLDALIIYFLHNALPANCKRSMMS